MTTTTRYRAGLTAALVAGAVAFAHAGSIELATYSAPDHPGCVAAPYAGPGSDQGYFCDRYAVDVDASSDPVADCLLDEGYHGRPDDQSETIYATSQAIDGCVKSVGESK